MQQIKMTAYSIVVFLLAASFYLYEFILQISPGVMTHELMADLGVGAWGLGLLSSCYYYAYTPMQLPAGLLYDRLGPRLLLGLAVIICACGALSFSIAQQLVFVAFGRVLMGFGSAFAFVGTLVLITRWFPARYFALLVGIVQFMGSMGAIVGETPLAAAVAYFGWRPTMYYLAFAGVVIGLLIWLIVRDWPSLAAQQQHEQNKHRLWRDLKEVFGQSQNLITAGYAFLIWAPITIFGALWGIPFLKAAYQLTTTQAGTAASMIWLGVAIGCPLMGLWSDKSHRRKRPILVCAAIGIISALLLLYVTLPLPLVYLFLFFFGVAAAGQSVSFGVVNDNNDREVVGAAIGLNNMAIVAGGALFQPLVGWLLHANWQGTMANSVPIYRLANYQHALIVVPVCYLLALLLAWFCLKETACKPSEALYAN